ncbi:MAG: 30S ribosomal protein S21 [Puniceicoccales bacterium]|jgi:small subunit ribosomal protein S21|nr:30S ribosomal protein S21 [Puniceicoccales bacterium]
MPTIEVKVRSGESIDRALRRLKKRLDRENVLQDAKAKCYFEKPCDRRRRKEKASRFTNFLRNKRESE